MVPNLSGHPALLVPKPSCHWRPLKQKSPDEREAKGKEERNERREENEQRKEKEHIEKNDQHREEPKGKYKNQ